MKSIALFIATCSAETDCGSLNNLLEEGNEAYFKSKGYSTKTKGAGYMQITGDDQKTYLTYKLKKKMKLKLKKNSKYFDNKDTATWIAKKYPWDSACWEWAQQEKGVGVVLNDYVTQYGASKGVFLVTQYFVNGYPDGADNDLRKVRKGVGFKYQKKNNLIKINSNKYRAPNIWSKRMRYYKKAVKYIK